MAFVEGTGGPVNGTGWKNQNKNQNSASKGGSGGASYDLSWLQNLYAQQQAAAAAAEQAKRAAAQQAAPVPVPTSSRDGAPSRACGSAFSSASYTAAKVAGMRDTA